MRGLLFAVATLILSSPALAAPPAFVAIVIDDMGNSLALGQRAIDLPGKLTYSVLPYTPYSRELANEAHLAGKEVMLHVPMSNLEGMPLGPGALTMSLSRRQFIKTFDAALESVPYVSGVNNHEGSLLTQQTLQMSWLMQEIRKHRLYFIDSRTTPRTVALHVALEDKVRAARRNVFLDDVLTMAAIGRQFNELIRVARRNGTAIAIGHPHEATLDYLQDAIPKLRALGIHLIPASTLIAVQRFAHLEYAQGENQRP